MDIWDFWGRGRRSDDDEVLLERMTEEAGRLFEGLSTMIEYVDLSMICKLFGFRILFMSMSFRNNQ